MNNIPFNSYGDYRLEVKGGFGTEVSTQRCDDLDSITLRDIHDICSNTREPLYALDLACGHGGQAVRMIKAGTTCVYALDLMDYQQEIAEAVKREHIEPDALHFIRGGFTELSHILPSDTQFDFISCQRALHYLPFPEAVNVLKTLKDHSTENTRLYISVSGLYGEEGEHYPHADKSVEERFILLDEPMRSKQNAQHPLCLYNEDDVRKLLQQSGWEPAEIYTSPFGTIKVAAKNNLAPHPVARSVPHFDV